MAYTEQELLDRLEKDLARPGELYTKDYIQSGERTADTEKAYSDIAASYLLAHRDRLQKTDTNWGMVHTSISTASDAAPRVLEALLAQKKFFHSFILDGAVSLTDGVKKPCGHFDFMTLDRAGEKLTLFEMVPAEEKEAELARILRCWSEKESVNRDILAKALGLTKLPRLSVVTLVTGAGNDRYGDAPREGESLALKQLSTLLSVPKLYLFHGLHAVPLNAGLAAPGQLMEAELLAELSEGSAHPETLYQKDYVNRLGVTGDTGRPYAEVLAAWLLAHRDIWMAAPHGFYRLSEGMRLEISSRNVTFQSIRKQRVLPPFGRVMQEDLVFLGSRGQQMGRPAMLLHAGDGYWSLLRALETVDGSDTLLRAVLRAFTHLVMTDTKRLTADLRLPEDTRLEARLLVDRDTPQADLFLRDLPYVSPLMKAMGVGLLFLGNGYEAMY